MRINYSGEKRRRELALKQKKEEKIKKIAERKALKNQQPEGGEGDQSQDDRDIDPDGNLDEAK